MAERVLQEWRVMQTWVKRVLHPQQRDGKYANLRYVQYTLELSKSEAQYSVSNSTVGDYIGLALFVGIVTRDQTPLVTRLRAVLVKLTSPCSEEATLKEI